MSIPSIEQLRVIGSEVSALRPDVDDAFDFYEALVERLRDDGWEPTETEMRNAIPQVLAAINRDEKRQEALRECKRLLDEFRTWSSKWDGWMGSVLQEHQGDGPPVVTITVVEDYVFIGDDLMIPAAEFEHVTGNLVAVYERVWSILNAHPELRLKVPEGGHDLMMLIYGCRREAADSRHAVDRARRLAERAAKRVEPKPMEGRRCSVDGCRKPARVDDLCKRHAYLAGTLPQGKIGEG